MFAIPGLAGRYPASRVFAVCAVVGAIFNTLFAGLDGVPSPAPAQRFLTGITLAGVYPIRDEASHRPGDAPAALRVRGGFVVANSPQFSALAAAACDSRDLGSALAMMNSIGFAIHIVSIELAILYPSAGGVFNWRLLLGL